MTLIPTDLLRRPCVNRAELLLISGAGAGGGDVVARTSLSEQAFMGLIDRAARHMGYGPSHCVLRSFHAGDLEMAYEKKNEQEHQQHQQLRVHVKRKRLLAWYDLPGAPVRVHVYDLVKLPFTAFDNSSAALQDVREVERLSLRVHKRARLVFERYVNRAGIRICRALIDVDLSKAGLDADMPDLQRTVENTVQALFVQKVQG